MAKLGEVGERKLIKNILSIIRPCPGLGPGDDAAILTESKGKIVVCTDSVTVERHKPDGMTWEHFGWMAAAVNFSDLAAMGARPTGMVAALVLPEDMDEKDLYDLMSGMDQCAEFCGTFIVGGDTKFGKGSVSATAIGTMDNREPMKRSGARPGDIVAVTGPLGAAAAGYYALKNGIDDEESIFSFTTPVPRVEAGVALSSTEAVTSCMDLSDGLAQAAKSICAASHTGMEIRMEFLPLGEGVVPICERLHMDVKDLALYWGGEYELMFTFKKEKIDELYQAGVTFSIIGTVTNDDGAYISDDNGREAMKDGQY